jgi:hypothetical protein
MQARNTEMKKRDIEANCIETKIAIRFNSFVKMSAGLHVPEM